MSSELDEKYWTERYEAGTTGWDIGNPSTPLKVFVDQLTDKDLKILIPGAGNCYEGEYLWNLGFKNTTIVDISKAPLQRFSERVPDFPREQLIHKDFFLLNEKFDIILEQTFYCALPPALRDNYVSKMHELLVDDGILAGVLFTFPLTEQGPPFGGSLEEYKNRFGNHFFLEVMEECRNSIPPRQGNEAFIKLRKKNINQIT